MFRMTKIVSLGLGTLLASTLAQGAISMKIEPTSKKETNAGITAASAYMSRGKTLNYHSVMKTFATSKTGPFTLGAELITPSNALEGEMPRELDVWASFGVNYGLLSASATAAAYTYPGAAAEPDSEISLSLGLDTILSPRIKAYYGVDGGAKDSIYVQGDVSQKVLKKGDFSLALDGVTGYEDKARNKDVDEGEEKISSPVGLYFVSVGSTASYGVVSLSASYVVSLNEEILDLDKGNKRKYVVALGASDTF